MKTQQTMSEKEQVKKYYNAKTQAIIKKYGPGIHDARAGPRIHFHIGTFPEISEEIADTNAQSLQQQLTRSQERTVRLAAQTWEAEKTIQGKRVMDVGCGLGGGAIFWAQLYDATVTAVTCAAEHLPVIEALSTMAGVSNKIQTQLCDACEVSAKFPYDAVVAMESSCYFNRKKWFEKLGEIVKDDGYVCIEDVFMQEVQPQQQDTNQIRAHKDKFDSYWKTDIGTVSEYVRYARMYGFELDVQQEITAKTQQFWTLSIAWNKVVIANHYANQNTNRSQSIGEGDHPSGQPDERKPNTIDPVDVGKLNESVTWHEYFFQLWQERTVQVHLLRFKKVAKTNNPVVCVDGEAQVMTNDVTLDGHHGEIPPSSSHHI